MRASTIVMIGFAVVFGLLAVFIAQAWLNSQAEMRMEALRRRRSRLAQRPSSSRRSRCATDRAERDLREMPWPAGCVAGGRLHQHLGNASGRRARRAGRDRAERAGAALKITGPGSARRCPRGRDGMKAVTMRVNDVEGVGGFVLPGDRVDVVLTRQTEKDKALDGSRAAKRRACSRSTRSPTTRRQAVGRQSGHARGSTAAREGVAGGFGRQSVAVAAQGRRNQQPRPQAHHAFRPRRPARRDRAEGARGRHAWRRRNRNTACRWKAPTSRASGGVR